MRGDVEARSVRLCWELAGSLDSSAFLRRYYARVARSQTDLPGGVGIEISSAPASMLAPCLGFPATTDRFLGSVRGSCCIKSCKGLQRHRARHSRRGVSTIRTSSWSGPPSKLRCERCPASPRLGRRVGHPTGDREAMIQIDNGKAGVE